jgi:hypothetical protein
MFENRVMRRIFRFRGDEILGGWKGFYNGQLQNILIWLYSTFHNLYSSKNITRMIMSE